MGTPIILTVSSGEQTQTITYSAYAYVYQLLNTPMDEALGNVTKALYLYGEAAKAYFSEAR